MRGGVSPNGRHRPNRESKRTRCVSSHAASHQSNPPPTSARQARQAARGRQARGGRRRPCPYPPLQPTCPSRHPPCRTAESSPMRFRHSGSEILTDREASTASAARDPSRQILAVRRLTSPGPDQVRAAHSRRPRRRPPRRGPGRRKGGRSVGGLGRRRTDSDTTLTGDDVGKVVGGGETTTTTTRDRTDRRRTTGERKKRRLAAFGGGRRGEGESKKKARALSG